MKAAVCHRFGAPLVIEDVALDPPGPGQVRVRLAACAICHSDVHFADGAWGGALPAVYGHEAAGDVIALGAGVAGVAVGSRVVVTLVRSCGQCTPCVDDMPVLCEDGFEGDGASAMHLAGGRPVTRAMHTGAFAEEVVVHASQVVPIDLAVPVDSAALLACGVITGVGAVINTAQVRPGSTVVVIGAGGVGLNAVQGAALAGAGSVVAVDVMVDKLAACRQFGATHALHATDDDLRGEIGHLTAGRGAECVIVSVGAPEAVSQALSLVARGGTVVLVGLPASGVTSAIDAGAIANDNIHLVGSKMGWSRIQRDIPRLVDLYVQGRLKLDQLISGRFGLDRINEAMDQVRRGEALRNVIMF